MKPLTPALLIIAFLVSTFPVSAFAADPVNRRDGFALIWHSTSRPVLATKEKPYADVPKDDAGYSVITYAKARGLLDDDQDHFYPDAPMTPSDALRWIFRTRSVEPLSENGDTVFMGIVGAQDVPVLASHYDIAYDTEAPTMTQDELFALMQRVDAVLAAEEHEVSLYAEKFHGKGTAFGETFDMHALTAAHRTFPVNTLVRVTNVDNGKSVTVRINDRGPFVQGRDLDLSLASFTTIAERSKGKIMATFERLGDVETVRRCKDDRYQRRVGRDLVLSLGVPHSFALGSTLSLSSLSPFVVRDVIYPDGTRSGMQTWVTDGEVFEIVPGITGLYRLMIGTKTGRLREMRMEVIDCNTP